MMAQIEKLARPRVDVLMMQMRIIQCIEKIGNKGNDALLKELTQLHEQQALLPSQ